MKAMRSLLTLVLLTLAFLSLSAQRYISVTDGSNTIVYRLNDTPAATSLYNQLPVSVEVEDYSDNEKIFYPPTLLTTTGNAEGDCPADTLALFSPWGDVVMFYKNSSRYTGLYILGEAVNGADRIEHLSGIIRVTVADAPTGINVVTKKHDDNKVYNLKGQQVSLNKSFSRGIFIKNRRKMTAK